MPNTGPAGASSAKMGSAQISRAAPVSTGRAFLQRSIIVGPPLAQPQFLHPLLQAALRDLELLGHGVDVVAAALQDFGTADLSRGADSRELAQQEVEGGA